MLMVYRSWPLTEAERSPIAVEMEFQGPAGNRSVQETATFSLVDDNNVTDNLIPFLIKLSSMWTHTPLFDV